MSNQIGLTTLYNDVQQIKKALGEDIVLVSGFVGNAILDIKGQQYEKLASDISLFVTGYKQNLPDNEIAYNDIAQLCTYTINYVETYINQFAKLKGVAVTSDLKLNTAIQLIKEVTTKFDDGFLTSTINHIVSLIYPHPTTPAPSPTLARAPSVKSVSKKTGTFLTKFMKKK